MRWLDSTRHRWLDSARHKLLDFLFPPRADEIALRTVSTDDFLALAAPRLAPLTRPGTVVLFSFDNILVRAAIHEAKYRGSARAFALLALALAEYLRDADDVGFRKPNIVVPVPLGKKRRKERGFNQVEEIAKRAKKELGLALDTSLLVRTRETTSQVSLDRGAREANMRGAFRVAENAANSINPACTYILIDDVVTTGATLQAAIDALKNAGAEHIIPLALAH